MHARIYTQVLQPPRRAVRPELPSRAWVNPFDFESCKARQGSLALANWRLSHRGKPHIMAWMTHRVVIHFRCQIDAPNPYGVSSGYFERIRRFETDLPRETAFKDNQLVGRPCSLRYRSQDLVARRHPGTAIIVKSVDKFAASHC